MSLLKDNDRNYLIDQFTRLTHPVKLIVFTQQFECDYCSDTREIAAEVASLSDKVSVEVYDFVADSAIAAQYGIDKIPATVVARGGNAPRDYGIRYYGVPAGYEFSSLIESVMLVSNGAPQLSAATQAWLATLTEPVHLQVFVTPTCPYCPRAVVLAHELAFASELVTADMVEATEFPHLANKYRVMGVPRTVINEATYVEGAVPEQTLLIKLQQALRAPHAV